MNLNCLVVRANCNEERLHSPDSISRYQMQSQIEHGISESISEKSMTTVNSTVFILTFVEFVLKYRSGKLVRYFLKNLYILWLKEINLLERIDVYVLTKSLRVFIIN